MTPPNEPAPASPSRPSTFVARTPPDLVAVVPAVLGFHPRDSVVLLTFGPPGGAFHARVDLPPGPEDRETVASVLADAVEANGVRRAAVLVYSDDAAAALGQAEVLVRRLLELDVEVIEVLRVHDGRWWPVPHGDEPGTPCDLDSHPLTAQRVFEGHVVHRDREELAASLVGSPTGKDGEDAVAVALAATRFADHTAAAHSGLEGQGGGHDHGFLRAEARWLQQCVRARLEDRRPLSARDAGRLLVLVSLVQTRDVAWAEINRANAAAHVDLWRDLVRRSPQELVPGAGSLLAFAAWQQGHGALAWCALDRVFDVDPDYSMGHCVAEALLRAVPPGVWRQIEQGELPVFRDPVPGPGPQPG